MTFCQGSVLTNLDNLTIQRQHLTNNDYLKNLELLKTNDDVLKTSTKKYFHRSFVDMSTYNVLIHSSANLNGSFGNVDSPRVLSSSGTNFDRISSPLDLYLIKMEDFRNVMSKLIPYPWITQNFRKIVLIPKEVIDFDNPSINLQTVSNNDIDLTNVKKITSGLTLNTVDVFQNLNFTNTELLNKFDLDEEDEHLLRNEYATIELYNFTGGQLLIDPSQLNRDTGLKIKGISVGGYKNELAIMVEDYKGRFQTISSFLNDSLFFKDFDDVPILIDNYQLALSRSAHQREYAESNLLTGKIKRIFEPENDLVDRLMSSVSIITDVINPINIAHGLVDDHDYYRRQKAEHLDLALTTPTITNQSNNYALARRNDFLGVTLLLSKPDEEETKKIKKYYKLFGYEMDKSNERLSSTRSMSICNYVQFTGQYTIPNVERSMLDIIKIQFENGVRLWHNNGTPNPFNQDILLNKREF